MNITMKATIQCDEAGCTREVSAKVTSQRRSVPAVGNTFVITDITIDDDKWWFNPTGSKLCALCPEHKKKIETPKKPATTLKGSSRGVGPVSK